MKSYIPENIKDTLYGFMPDVQSSSTAPHPLITTIIRRQNRARATPLVQLCNPRPFPCGTMGDESWLTRERLLGDEHSSLLVDPNDTLFIKLPAKEYPYTLQPFRVCSQLLRR